MEFLVNLISIEQAYRDPNSLTKYQLDFINENCTHIVNQWYFFEGDTDAFDEVELDYEFMDQLIVEPLGDLSQEELIELAMLDLDEESGEWVW